MLATCLTVVYADGAVRPEELVAVRAGTAEIGTPASDVGQLFALVKDYLLAQLTRLPDTGSVVAVTRELG